MSLSLSGRTNIQEVKFIRTQTANLLEYAEGQRYCGSFNDIRITVGGDNFPANRMVLSCFSHFFETMFKTEMKEKYQDSVELENVDRDSMKNLIDFIYTGSININSENVCNLLSASDYLQIEDVKKFCFKFLASAITSENCFIVLTLADRYMNDEVASQSKKFIADNFEEVVCSLDFKNLTKKEMTTCISKLDRDTAKETTIYEAIIKWTNHDLDNRECEFLEHFKLVDLQKLPTEFLNKTVFIENLVINNVNCFKALIPVIKERLKSSSKKDQKTKILSLGGEKTKSKVIEVYNICNERKKKFPDLPVGRDSGCAISLREYVYFVGGMTSDELSDTTNLVHRMNLTELKWEEIGGMNVNRRDMGATVVNDTLVVVGGVDNENICLSSGECFDQVMKSWENTSPLTSDRCDHALVSCKGSIYSIGGLHENHLSTVERCRPPAVAWNELKSLRTPRSQLAVVNCDDVIYAIGGISGEAILKSSEKYDVGKDEWTYISDMKFARHAFSACVMQGKIYVVGGLDSSDEVVKEIECYDPSTNEWSIVGKTDIDLSYHSIVAV